MRACKSQNDQEIAYRDACYVYCATRSGYYLLEDEGRKKLRLHLPPILPSLFVGAKVGCGVFHIGSKDIRAIGAQPCVTTILELTIHSGATQMHVHKHTPRLAYLTSDAHDASERGTSGRPDNPCLVGVPNTEKRNFGWFESVTKQEGQNQNWLPHPCLLGGPKDGKNATPPLHSRRSPSKERQNQNWLPHACLLGGPKRGRKCYVTHALPGISKQRRTKSEWAASCLPSQGATTGRKSYGILAFSGNPKQKMTKSELATSPLRCQG